MRTISWQGAQREIGLEVGFEANGDSGLALETGNQLAERLLQVVGHGNRRLHPPCQHAEAADFAAERRLHARELRGVVGGDFRDFAADDIDAKFGRRDRLQQAIVEFTSDARTFARFGPRAQPAQPEHVVGGWCNFRRRCAARAEWRSRARTTEARGREGKPGRSRRRGTKPERKSRSGI
jgi:hypothetical protein